MLGRSVPTFYGPFFNQSFASVKEWQPLLNRDWFWVVQQAVCLNTDNSLGVKGHHRCRKSLIWAFWDTITWLVKPVKQSVALVYNIVLEVLYVLAVV